MTVKDLTAFLTPDLVLVHRGTRYTAAPPTVEVGLKLAALMAAGVAAQALHVGATTAEVEAALTDEQQALLASIRDVPIGQLTLGPAYQQMIDDGLPGPDVDMYSLYAYYYWTLGEAAADAIVAQVRGGGTAPKDPKPSRSGRRTGSASQTATVSTPTTESRTT